MLRRLSMAGLCLGLVSIGGVGGFQLGANGQTSAPAQAGAPTAPADTAAMRANYERWRTEFKTWGKWGPNDNKGTSNLITPQKVLSAMKLVKSGIVVSLAHPEPQQAAADVNANGVFRRTTNGITAGGTTDTYQVSYHGLTVAHMDTWCHFSSMVRCSRDAGEGEHHARDRMQAGQCHELERRHRDPGRASDIAQLKGVDWVEPGTPITRADLEAWEKSRASRPDLAMSCTAHRPLEETREDGAVGRSGLGAYADTIPGCTSGSQPSSVTTSTSTGIRDRGGRECPTRSISRCSTGWDQHCRVPRPEQAVRPRGD